LVAVDPATGEIATSPIPIGDEFEVVTVAVAGGQLWIGGYIAQDSVWYSAVEGYVIPVDLASIDELEEISLDSSAIRLEGTPRAMAFDGSRLWVVEDGNRTIQAIDPVNFNIVATKQTDIDPDSLVVEGSRVWLRDIDGEMLQTVVLLR
jgi:streptogramin lyase